MTGLNISLQRFAYLVSADTGHHYVRHHEIGIILNGQFQSLLSVYCGKYIVIFFKRVTNNVQQFWIVFYYEQRRLIMIPDSNVRSRLNRDKCILRLGSHMPVVNLISSKATLQQR